MYKIVLTPNTRKLDIEVEVFIVIKYKVAVNKLYYTVGLLN